MGFKKDKDETISESGNWNVADSYAKAKIMRPLVMSDYYEDIAIYGYDSIIDELVNYSTPPNDFIRITALQRLIKELIKLINNAKFALKIKGTKVKILEHKSNLKKLEMVIPKLWGFKYNQTTKIKEPFIKDEVIFRDFIEKISEIKSKINEPLNQNHLIFTDKEEFDPRAFKDRMKDRMVNQG